MFFNFLRKKFVDESIDEQKKDLGNEILRLYPLAVNGKDCDSLFDDRQDFSHNIDNPVPVNGVLGEIKYINRLRCKCGVGLVYHRLGSASSKKIDGRVDIYETVCIRGVHWDILYFHFYHPRRSTWLPMGYKFSDFHPIFSRYPMGYGTNRFVNDFPFGLGKYILLHLGDGLGKAFIKRYDKVIENRNKFIKPEDHKIKLSSLKLNLNSFYELREIVDERNIKQ